MEIFREFTFDAAHRLPNVPPEHKCFRLHGHTYFLTIYIEDLIDEQMGWVIDFGEIKNKTGPILDQLDHHYLNEVEGLENPTVENIAQWLWIRLKPLLPGLSRVALREGHRSGCEYKGSDSPIHK